MTFRENQFMRLQSCKLWVLCSKVLRPSNITLINLHLWKLETKQLVYSKVTWTPTWAQAHSHNFITRRMKCIRKSTKGSGRNLSFGASLQKFETFLESIEIAIKTILSAEVLIFAGTWNKSSKRRRLARKKRWSCWFISDCIELI